MGLRFFAVMPCFVQSTNTPRAPKALFESDRSAYACAVMRAVLNTHHYINTLNVINAELLHYFRRLTDR